MIQAASEEILQQNSGGERPPLSLPKRIVFSIISLFLAFLVFGILGEAALQLLPMGRYQSGIFRQYDAVFGESLIPNVSVIHRRGCFQGLVQTNSWGFRDRARTLEKPPGTYRVALIGDSVVEAVHVQPNEVMNIQMEQMLREKGYPNVEVLAFGIGGIGTTQELLLYERKIRQFHPDVVVLTFSDNDVMNNSSTLQPESYGIHTWYAPYYNLGPNGELVFQPVESRPFNGLVTLLERHSKLVYYLERIWFKFDYSPHTWQGVPIYYGSYSSDPDPEWQKAWTVTSKVLAGFGQEVTADGGKFQVLLWPDFADIDPGWHERLTKQLGHIPGQLVPAKFTEHVREAAEKANVPFDTLAPYMQAYRDENHLQWPYFSLPCDPHFSPLGHKVAAGAIIQKLEQHNLLPPGNKLAN